MVAESPKVHYLESTANLRQFITVAKIPPTLAWHPEAKAKQFYWQTFCSDSGFRSTNHLPL